MSDLPVSTRPTYATVEPDQLGEYVGYGIRAHVIDKRPRAGGNFAVVTILTVEPGPMPGTARVVTVENPDFHTDIAQPIEVFASRTCRTPAAPGARLWPLPWNRVIPMSKPRVIERRMPGVFRADGQVAGQVLFLGGVELPADRLAEFLGACHLAIAPQDEHYDIDGLIAQLLEEAR